MLIGILIIGFHFALLTLNDVDSDHEERTTRFNRAFRESISQMANNEQLNIIKEGANAWNEWRRTTFRGEPNLSGADLPLAELNGA